MSAEVIGGLQRQLGARGCMCPDGPPHGRTRIQPAPRASKGPACPAWALPVMRRALEAGFVANALHTDGVFVLRGSPSVFK